MYNYHSAVIPMTDAVVAKGQRAWGKIKTSAAEQRQLWREVGDALLVGRKLHKADQKFSAWCKENGFDDVPAQTRTLALWLSANWSIVTIDLPADLSHPKNIREWFNAQPAPAPLTDLDISALAPQLQIDRKVASRINKLAAMAEMGEGQEKGTAQKYLKSQAKRMGVDEQEMVSLSKNLDPTLSTPANRLPVLDTTLDMLNTKLADILHFIKDTQQGALTTPVSLDYVIALLHEAKTELNIA
jgi:hypothetical protein